MYLCSVCNLDNCHILPAHVCNSEAVIKFNNNNNSRCDGVRVRAPDVSHCLLRKSLK